MNTKTTNTCLGLLRTFEICVLLFSLYSSAFGQSCEDNLVTAEENYSFGNFQNVKENLTEECLARFEKGSARRAYLLIAKTDIELRRLGMVDADSAADYSAYWAIEELLTRVDPDFFPNESDGPEELRLIVSRVKWEVYKNRIFSIMKSQDFINQIPATVSIITSEEIQQRGYIDLESIFHDLPGFDISRHGGANYSTLYQRGYRSIGTDRTLLLIDGVEDNELWTNFINLSRQYSLSNIDRIEIIHGPASTFYGANSFAGVVNIITKDETALIKDNRQVGISASAGAGTFNTAFGEATVGKRFKNDVFLSLTGRYYRTDEMDRSSNSGWKEWDNNWDYSYNFFDEEQYFNSMTLFGEEAAAIDSIYGESPLYDYDGNIMTPTPTAILEARNRDSITYESTKFSNETENWLLAGKLRISDFTIGAQIWHTDESTIGMFRDSLRGGTNEGGIWRTENIFYYLKYEKKLTDRFSITSFTRYKTNSTIPFSAASIFKGYHGGRLGLEDLLNDEPDGTPWYRTNRYQTSRQFRTELITHYNDAAEKWDLLAGIEYRSSLIQGNYIQSEDNINPVDSGALVEPLISGGNNFPFRDIGIYAQSSFKAREKWILSLGLRLDKNRVRQNLGFGWAFNPRLAVIYGPRPEVNVKFIYSEAFKDAANFVKYTTTQNRMLPAENLEPEKARNAEINIRYQKRQSGNRLMGEFVCYYTTYSQLVSLVDNVPIDDGSGQVTSQFQNSDNAIEVLGVQLDGKWFFNQHNYTWPAHIFGNATITSAKESESNYDVADIAFFKANLGVNISFLKNFNLNARVNYVGNRPVGENTTVSTNPMESIDPYAILNATVTYEVPKTGISIQLIGNNILNNHYYHPGVWEADNIDFAQRIPQNTRTLYGRILYSF